MVHQVPERHRQAVIVLTGGRSSRLGRHKPTLRVGDRTMLEAALGAAGDRMTVVVGRGDGVPAAIPAILDDSADGGPVVGIATGLRWLLEEHGSDRFDTVFVLAADQPFLTAEALDRLDEGRRAAAADLALFRDRSGRRQPLCVAWSSRALGQTIAALDEPVGAPVRALFRDLTVAELLDVDDSTLDVDTEDALHEARQLATRRPEPPT